MWHMRRGPERERLDICCYLSMYAFAFSFHPSPGTLTNEDASCQASTAPNIISLGPASPSCCLPDIIHGESGRRWRRSGVGVFVLQLDRGECQSDSPHSKTLRSFKLPSPLHLPEGIVSARRSHHSGVDFRQSASVFESEGGTPAGQHVGLGAAWAAFASRCSLRWRRRRASSARQETFCKRNLRRFCRFGPYSWNSRILPSVHRIFARGTR